MYCVYILYNLKQCLVLEFGVFLYSSKNFSAWACMKVVFQEIFFSYWNWSSMLCTIYFLHFFVVLFSHGDEHTKEYCIVTYIESWCSVLKPWKHHSILCFHWRECVVVCLWTGARFSRNCFEGSNNGHDKGIKYRFTNLRYVNVNYFTSVSHMALNNGWNWTKILWWIF